MENIFKDINYRYAIGEILIVITGILFAFAINNCSNNLKSKKILRGSLESLQSDLTKDHYEIMRLIEVHDEKIQDLKQLKQLLQYETDQEELMVELIRKQLESPTFYPLSATYNSLLSSGDIHLIEDLELKKNLFNLYENVYKRAVYNGQLYDKVHIEKFNDQVFKYMDADGGTLPDNQLRSPEIVFAVGYLIKAAQAYRQLLDGTSKDIALISEKIENY